MKNKCKLRGHHLICLHFFMGKGYDEVFVENTKRILENTGEVEVVDGIDDVCKSCPHNAGFCNYKPDSEKEVRRIDSFSLKLLNLKVGDTVKWDDLRVKIPLVIREWQKFACKDCDWRDICFSQKD
uniref:DUF1284 domain-containing protein n=1 Tax=Archaeoglobus fulgidus TaxID=2234 RepID=A0A7C3MAJ9_ARCFL